MDYKKLQNGSDIRGVALEGIEGQSVNLTESVCYDIGRGFALWLIKKTGKKNLRVAIGRDSRLSGETLTSWISNAMVNEGIYVTDFGMASTPAMFMSTITEGYEFDGSVMVTASHLPFNRNGFKFFTKNGGVESSDIKEILAFAESNEKTGLKKGELFNGEFMNKYSEILADKIRKTTGEQTPLKGFKIVVDAGNGAGGFYVDKVLKPLGADTTGSRFLDPDGSFPNHIPNPENEEAMKSIMDAVKENKADFGIIFDTDVDRMSAVLSDGSEVNRDSIIAMISAILAPQYPGSTIITDSVTSDRLTYFLEDVLGLKHLCYMRGYKNVINKQKELNAAGTVAPLAMETSGHGALKDNYFLDDGAFLAVKLVIALANAAKEGKKLDSLIEKLPPLVEEGEYRFKISGDDFKDYGNGVLAEFKKRAEAAGYTMPQSYEGVRLSFKGEDVQGWILLRLSLHDPVMPLNIEGGRKGDLAKLVEIAKKLTDGFDRLDRSCLK